MIVWYKNNVTLHVDCNWKINFKQWLFDIYEIKAGFLAHLYFLNVLQCTVLLLKLEKLTNIKEQNKWDKQIYQESNEAKASGPVHIQALSNPVGKAVAL